MSHRIPASERTREALSDLIEGRLSSESGRTELVQLATRLIVEEGLEAEVRDALGREYYARGGEPSRGYRNGVREGRLKTAEGAIAYSAPQVAGGEVRLVPLARERVVLGVGAHAELGRAGVRLARALLADQHGLPAVDFHLIKSIPSGAGLGGGSADGAFALTLLDAHFKLGLSTAELEAHAATLGSDCPFFIRNSPAHVTGRGEHIAPIDLRLAGWHIVLLNPGVHIPTAAAFRWITPDKDRPGLDAMTGSGPEAWDGHLLNDFTAPAVERHPVIGEALETLKEAGATFADMSGSGSTVFGFFREPPSPTLTAGLAPNWRSWTGQFPD